MSHNLEINNGEARFAYSNHQRPWHRLGTPMEGLQTADAMLKAANADFTVNLVKVAAVDADGNVIFNTDGTPVIIEDSRATIRDNGDGTFNGLATVGGRYHIQQNREVLERALAVVGATKGDAVVDTVGVLHGGKRFFASLDLGSLVIDPTGINDVVHSNLLVFTGHDGRTPITYSNTNVRAVCENTVRMGLSSARATFKAKHTPNVEAAMEDAQRVLQISTDWADAFKMTAEQMLTVDVRPGTGRVDKVMDAIFPLADADTDRKLNNRNDTIDVIKAIWENPRNAGHAGHNGWTLYNSVVEYLDHYRDATPEARALTSMEETSWVTRMKIDTQNAVLALA
jgi:phage/plasmid-like protein (TIGR03299 family)